MGPRELAPRHSLSRNLLSQWLRKYETGQLTDEIVDAVRIAEYEDKIAELERKVGQLTMDLLKKGRAWPASRTARAIPWSATRRFRRRTRMPNHEAGALNLLSPRAAREIALR
jgi:hypothetical protein